ncbi:MAG TPA: virulence protein [Spirochaetia bacterium]|mgnify:FL=1|nr:virulence protein [Spirochaetia bacterium]HRV30031.1 virulence protein [Spirochaetia bacterium]
MKANYNVTGNERKVLVAAIAELTGEKPIYKFMPTCAYEIGDITVDKEGGVTCEDADKLERIIHNLIADGFTPEDAEEIESAEEEATAEEADKNGTGLTVSVPLDKAAVGNLTNLLTAKESLIKKALGINDLGIEVTEDVISFPWFSEMPEPDAVKAYTHFIAALCKMSKDLKRASATEKDVDNEKYAFRCFLLRLGFIGNEYKAERKILLKNLSGNSSWKNGAPEKEVAACE